MQDTSKCTVYKLLSCLLAYPEGDAFWQGLTEIQDCTLTLPETSSTRWLCKAIEAWAHCEREALRREFVQNFDFRESTCLYLTAHEYGDSRERGIALIELHRLYHLAGFEASTNELPDYLPALFELLSVVPPEFPAENLERRIALVCHRILDNLSEDSLYNSVFCAALAALPQVAYEGETIAFPKRQAADLDPLPYPRGN